MLFYSSIMHLSKWSPERARPTKVNHFIHAYHPCAYKKKKNLFFIFSNLRVENCYFPHDYTDVCSTVRVHITNNLFFVTTHAEIQIRFRITRLFWSVLIFFKTTFHIWSKSPWLNSWQQFFSFAFICLHQRHGKCFSVKRFSHH